MVPYQSLRPGQNVLEDLEGVVGVLRLDQLEPSGQVDLELHLPFGFLVQLLLDQKLLTFQPFSFAFRQLPERSNKLIYFWGSAWR